MIIYIINRCIKSYINVFILGYICKCHLNDFIGGIVFCSYINTILILNNKKTIDKYYQLFIIMIIVSIIWEYVAPLILSYSVSDKWDILAYMLGTTTYYLLKRKARS